MNHDEIWTVLQNRISLVGPFGIREPKSMNFTAKNCLVWGAHFRCAAKWPDHKPQNPVIIGKERMSECQWEFDLHFTINRSEIPNKVTWHDTALAQQVFEDLHRPKFSGDFGLAGEGRDFSEIISPISANFGTPTEPSDSVLLRGPRDFSVRF